MSQLMRLWFLSHRWSAKAQASLRIRAVSPEPSLFTHLKYGPTKNQTSSCQILAKIKFSRIIVDLQYSHRMMANVES